MAAAPSPATWQSKGTALFSIPLLVRPQPNSNEHYLGYWLRTADENGLTIPSWLTLPKAESNLPKGVGRARWCPCCLAKHDAYWPTDWDTGWALCLEHQCWLEDVCPECKKVTRWRSIRHLACKCGFSFATAEPRKISDDLGKLLWVPPGKMSPTDRWMTLEVEARLRLAEFIGSLQLYGLYGKPLKKVSGTAVETQRNALTVGAAVLVAGESAFHRLLGQLRRPAIHKSVPQLINEAYPGLLNRMRKCLTHQERENLWGEIHNFLGTTLDTEQPVLWNRKRSRSSHSARDCAAKLKMRPGRVKEMLLEHGVSPAIRQSSAGRTMLAISSAQLKDIEARVQEWIPYRQAARMCGLSPARQKELIRTGWLQGRASKIQKSSLRKLFDKLNAASSSSQVISSMKTVTLSTALQRYIPLPLTDSFLAALVACEVGLYVDKDAVNHCNDMQVALDDVLAFDKKDKGQAAAYLSLPDAAPHMKLKQEVLYHLVNQGHISTTIQRIGRRAARFISLEEIQRFATENESLAVAAARANVGARAAVCWAQGKGLELFSGPGIDGGRQYFVRRVDFQR